MSRTTAMINHCVIDESVYKVIVFLLSNNHINDIIVAPFDFKDEDITSRYISFLKMLSLSLTEFTIPFFKNNVYFYFGNDTGRKIRIISFHYFLYVQSFITIQTEWYVIQFVISHLTALKVVLITPYLIYSKYSREWRLHEPTCSAEVFQAVGILYNFTHSHTEWSDGQEVKICIPNNV